MEALYDSPFFGITLSIFVFALSQWLHKKLNKHPLANPMLLTVIILISILGIFRIPYDAYNKGGAYIGMLLTPVVCVLGLSIYQKLPLLKKNMFPILAGVTVGSLTSLGSVVVLCKLFGLEEIIMRSMLAKSVTVAIAMDVSKGLGGIVPITISSVVITGISGAVLLPMVAKLFKIDNDVAQGLGMGTTSHGIGTARAVELSDTMGAIAGLAVGLAGVVTVVAALILF